MKTELALEFDKIRRQVSDLCRTGRGADKIHTDPTRDDEEDLRQLLDVVEAACRMLDSGVSAPSFEVAELSPVWHRLTVEGVRLDLEELGEVRRLLEAAVATKSWCHHEQAGDPVRSQADRIVVVDDLLDQLKRYLLPNDQLNADAIPDLRRLQSQEASLNNKIHSTARQIIQRSKSMFRNSEPMIRDGRTVLALAANFKGQVDGIIHESSGTGATVFVEPRELVALNNELVTIHNERFRVVQRVLADLTDHVAVEKESLETLEATIAELDGILARAQWSVRFRGIRPALGDRVVLRKARHPLLGDACIPLEVDFGPHSRLLVVSGPNTGGKTVLLKTVGLAVLTHQFGLLVPADEGSSLPIFDYIGVDIGDEQSLAESLSTFSAHLRTQAEILRRAGKRSLVLIDELGAGTDPEEAASLALALIDYLIERDATVLVTTHQTVLKHYGYTNPRARNVSMEFDQTARRPTFRVIPDVPGQSFAIETAEAVGLVPEVVQKAREYRDRERSDVSTIIARLSEQERLLTQERADLEAQQNKLAAELSGVKVERDRILAREKELREAGLRELNEVIRQSRQEIEATVRRIRNRGRKGKSVESEHIQAAHQAVGAAGEARDREEQRLQEIAELTRLQRTESDAPIGEGTSVRHVGSGKTGTVVRVRGDKLQVQFAGGVRMDVKRSDLVPLQEDNASNTRSMVDVSVSSGSAGSPSLEIDLRGMRLAEAVAELDRQIDRAVLAGMGRFSIVHGTGTGVLQKGVRDHLNSVPQVEQIEFASPETGGFGRTIVTLGSKPLS